PGHEVAAKQMRGFGGMVSFRHAGGEEAAVAMCGRTRLFTLGESLGGVQSLPARPSPTPRPPGKPTASMARWCCYRDTNGPSMRLAQGAGGTQGAGGWREELAVGARSWRLARGAGGGARSWRRGRWRRGRWRWRPSRGRAGRPVARAARCA
ncbi:MAG TPA: PLP-dependent transferase, partial [Streptosporangiaceae bacterium]|nr:PLP-dependent transferase [Streptosporangiaceae bacterium]